MALTVDLIFTCTTSLISAARVNADQTLTIDASLFDPPTLMVDKDRQLASTGRRKGTTEYGRWREGRIKTPYITSAERIYWREFYESVAAEEPFRLVSTGFWGVDSDLQDLWVYVTDSNFDTPRIDLLDAYSSEFNFREVDV